MKPLQIEAWALRVIEAVEQGRPNEDVQVELKAEWPSDIPRTARQIAGHANAARGEPILWLIGVDQLTGVVGVAAEELSVWLPRIVAQFDGLAPRLTDLNIPVRGQTVVALLFGSDRAPFVVKNPAFGTRGGGAVALEAPWREGTTTTSATRENLVRLLAPLQLVPEVRLLRCEARVERARSDPTARRLYVTAKLYVVPRSDTRIVITFHDAEVYLEPVMHCRPCG